MYKSLSFFGKVVSLVLLIIAMVIIKNYNIFLLICGMVFLVSFINKDNKYFFFCLLLFIYTYLSTYNEVTFIVLKVLLVGIYALIIESSLMSLEKRYLYDLFFYRSKSSKRLRNYIKKYYYRELYNNNVENNQKINKYVTNTKKYNKYLDNEVSKKTEKEIDDLYLVDRVRYDHYFNHKKGRITFAWNNYDNFYIAVSLVLFVITFVFGR